MRRRMRSQAPLCSGVWTYLGHQTALIFSGTRKRGRSFLIALTRSSSEAARGTSARRGPSISLWRGADRGGGGGGAKRKGRTPGGGGHFQRGPGGSGVFA